MTKGKGKTLENNLKNIMKAYFTPSYWPNRSGLQNGFDAYAKFLFNKKEYVWKFECKDHDALKHKKNFNLIREIEIKDFSDKLMQILALNEPYFPHVFCLFFPHKRIGNNNNLRENVDSWNTYNKFPFKIVIWDFDFLKDKIPYLNIQDAKDIYPNSNIDDISRHSAVTDEIRLKIETESVDGYLFNRSYIRERNAKHSLMVENNFIIRVDFLEESGDKFFQFTANGTIFKYNLNNFSNVSMDEYPSKPVKSVPTKAEMPPQYHETQTMFAQPPLKAEGDISFDKKAYDEMVAKKKEELLRVFKTGSGPTLYTLIVEFCKKHENGVISFICQKRHSNFARFPIKELNSKDFEANSVIHFYFEFNLQI